VTEKVTVCRVYDTTKQAYWTSPAGKTHWKKANHAKNAWNCACAWGGRGLFDANPHMEIHTFELNRID